MIDPDRPDFANHPAAPGRARYPYAPEAEQVPVTVSILTAFFNTDEVFLETVESVIGQSLQEWEWIIVDDGSTDEEALAHLRDLIAREPRVVVVHQPNAGPAAARNAAFRLAKGKYVALLDSDDLIEPTFLEKTIWFLETQPAFAFCNTWSVTFGQQESLTTTGFEWGRAHVTMNSGPPHSLIRREAYAAIKGFDETIRLGHEDWDFWLAMADAGFWGHTLPEYLEWYRRRESGRYAQVVAASDIDRRFRQYIRRKYGRLSSRFPNPRLRRGRPYETVPSALPFDNLLAREADGRRVLFLIPWMVTGGADKVNLDWISGLAAGGARVSVCATLRARHEWLPKFAEVTPDVFILPNFLHPTDFPRFIVYLIRSRGIDTVVVSNSTLGYQLLPFLRAACRGVTFVDVSHVEEPHWLNGGHPRFGVGYQEALDLNVVTTRNLRDWMVGRGAEAGRIEVCYTGVAALPLVDDPAKRLAKRNALGVAKDVPLIVYAGRICAQKRPELLVSVLRALAERDVPFHCAVIGDGELMPLLRQRIRRYGLQGSVSLLGTVSHQEWLDVLAVGDIFLLPSHYEGISVALYEAMAMKVVPIVSAIGGQPEVVTPDCGILVPQADSEQEDYVLAVKRLVDNPQQREAMAAAARRRVTTEFTQEGSRTRFASLLARARELSISSPRVGLPLGLAIESATLAVEYRRLTTPELVPTGIQRFLAWARTYKVGRVLLRMRWVRAGGKWLLRTVRGTGG